MFLNLNQKQNLRYPILLYDPMIRISGSQWSNLKPMFFSESSTMCIDTLVEVHGKASHYPLLRNILVRLMMTKEIVQ